MQFQFDANQEHQLPAIQAVIDLFQGQGRIAAGMKFTLGQSGSLAAVPNRLDLKRSTLLDNLRAVQGRNRIALDDDLQFIEETIQTPDGPATRRFANFSVEMETGTGKTYVYLRTIQELFRTYGMRKFIIVVPSVAIREGVLKTLRITEEHFDEIYDNPVYRFYEYDSANLTQVRHFAQSDGIEVMVMTIDSFNKAANVIRQSTDRLQGETPIHLVQAARPILILDEPQNMESEKAIAALALLDPLFALRYSATHRNPYNIVHRLTPAEAYQQGLVKKIEVDSVVQEHDANEPFVSLESIQTKKTRITAKLRVHKLMRSGTVKEAAVTVKPGDTLEQKANRREYAGFEIDEINPGGQFVRFANNVEMKVGAEIGADKDAIFKSQIRHTVAEHFRKQARLKERGIKVLSLFFIDRVDNYAAEDGLIRQLFDQAFDELKLQYPDWSELSPADVQAAYFASKRRKSGEVELLDSKSGESADDAAAYDLIMRDKESLLSFPTPNDDEEVRRKRQVAFVFSHSALREGWDNPNVFQICTLNQTASLTKKRQEVGRGVRLCVDQQGNRIQDEQINVLTVVANEAYKDYVETYQREIADEYRAEIEARYGKSIEELSDEDRLKIAEEYGEGILPPKPRKAGQQKAKLRKQRALSPEFQELWARIKHKTRYAVKIDTEKLLAEVLPELDQADISTPRVTITKAQFTVDDDGIFEAMQLSAAKTAVDLAGRYPLPNLVEIMSNLMEHTSPPVRLTRRTLREVFRRTKTKEQAIQNPHEWCAKAVQIIKEKLADHLVNGIEYTKIADLPGADALPEEAKWYEMQQILDKEEVELFGEHIVAVDDSEKTLYDLVPCDSKVETAFVKQLENRQDVKAYLKLPPWFTVPTPVGEYNPDWAIVMQETDENGKPILYLVTETKGSTKKDDLRPDEWRKIQCGAAHFGSKQLKKTGPLEGVDYALVTDAGQLPTPKAG